MIRLRRSLASDYSCHLTYCLLVDALYGNCDRYCLISNLKLDVISLRDDELVLGLAVRHKGVSKVKLYVLANLCCLVDGVTRMGAVAKNLTVIVT